LSCYLCGGITNQKPKNNCTHIQTLGLFWNAVIYERKKERLYGGESKCVDTTPKKKIDVGRLVGGVGYFSEQTRILSGFQFTTHFIEIFAVETK